MDAESQELSTSSHYRVAAMESQERAESLLKPRLDY